MCGFLPQNPLFLGCEWASPHANLGKMAAYRASRYNRRPRTHRSQTMSLSQEFVQNALKEVIDPNTGKDLMATKSARNIKLDGANVSLDVELAYPAKTQIELMKKAVLVRLRKMGGIGEVGVNVASRIVAHSVQRGVKLIPGVKNIIAVASGKGGVGKSTT